MHIPRQRAFTLIETLVVIAIAVVLMALLVPVISRDVFRRSSRAAVCQWNVNQLMTAVNLYLKDNRGIYPGGEHTVRLEDGSTQTVDITAWNLFGSTGQVAGGIGDATPESLRPINSYLSDTGATRCPADQSSSLSQDAPHFERYGSSYYYLARDKSAINDRRNVIYDGAWMIGGHRAGEITRPDRKAVIADAILPWMNPFVFSGDDPSNFWHSDEPEVLAENSTSRRLKVTMGFADGHVEQVRRKAGDLWALPANEVNADADAIADLLRLPDPLPDHVLPEEVNEIYY